MSKVSSDRVTRYLRISSLRFLEMEAVNLDRALESAVATSAEVTKLVETYRTKLAELEPLRRALDWLHGKSALSAHKGWNDSSQLQDFSLLSVWQVSWAAMEGDANAKLPD